jgi:predicted O-linked N-acetylglucosamine transferase (SPINDLY family)
MTPLPAGLDDALARARALHQAGRLDEAEALYRGVIADEPGRAEAHFFLGLVCEARGDQAAAADAYTRAVAHAPGLAEAHYNLGLLHKRGGRFAEAVAAYRQAIRARPDFADAYHNLAGALEALGHFDRAAAIYRRALALRPDAPETHHNLGNALRALGTLDDAAAAYAEAIRLRPDYAEARNNLGNVLKARGKLDLAAAQLRRAIADRPDYAEAHTNLGLVLQDQRKFAEAAACHLAAIARQPEFALAHYNLGVARDAQGEAEPAIACYRRALALDPRMESAHFNLGRALQRQGRLTEAEACYAQALALAPDRSGTHLNLGNLRLSQSRLAEAEAHYRRAIALQPDHAEAHSNLIFARNFDPALDTAAQQAEHKRYQLLHGQRFTAAMRPHDNDPDPERRLRVGYVSADFFRHSAALSFGPVLRNHGPEFEVVCYSGVTREDEVTEAFRARAALWRSTLDVDDDALAQQIRDDRIDILVDLSGHTAGNRLPVFARKPAPVQVTAWGHAAGTGLAAIDALLADPIVVPPAEHRHFVEDVVDLPCVIGFEAMADTPDVSALPALADGRVTFGSLNRLSKLSDAVLHCWAAVLAGCPRSRLVLKYWQIEDPSQQQRIHAAFAARGIGAERVILIGGSSHVAHLATYHRIDIALDPFPHGGGITTCEALWMGVPVVTLRGRTVTARVGASVLGALGLNDLIAETESHYVAIGQSLAHNLPALAGLRRSLRHRLAAAEFGDPARYARAVEAVYRRLWRDWCRRQRDPAEGLRRAASHLNRGAAAQQAGDADAAAIAFARAIAGKPDYAEAHYNLGIVCEAKGDGAGAAAAYVRATACKADYAEAHNNLGNVLLARGETKAAEAHYAAAVAARPDFGTAAYNLGIACQRQGRLAEAEGAYRRAVELLPDFATAHSNLGLVLLSAGRHKEAIAALEHAAAIAPNDAETHSNLIFARNFDPALDTAAQQAEHLKWHERHAARYAAAIAPHRNVPDPDRRLRVGYVSADFHWHSAALAFGPVIRGHGEGFAVACYSSGAREDEITQALRAKAALWREARTMSDDALAALIRADDIDILVDLSGHSAGNRLLVFARKPAPVQVTAWGHATGTGLAAIDALFADRTAIPEEERHLFAERIVDLPCILGFAAPADAPPVAPLPALARGHVTFGSLNRLAKVSADMLRLWARILAAVPGSRLVVKDRALDEPAQRARVGDALAAAGIAAERIALVGGSPHVEHLAAYGEVDIALDPFPHGGGITTCEALWMGVPVVALHGRTVTSRIAASILTAGGLPGWVARSEAEYVAKACEAARDLDRLAALRLGLRQRIAASPFGDPGQYCRAVEGAYRQLWREWCRRQ